MRIILDQVSSCECASNHNTATCVTYRECSVAAGLELLPLLEKVHHTAADKNGRLRSAWLNHFHCHLPEAPDMTETLAQKKCTPCRGGVPPLTHEEAERFQSQTPNWDLVDDTHRIERTFRFRNFQEALGFVRNVGDLAETEGHHPDISFGWGYATVSLRTKKIKGLHENDFIMASKVDGIFDRSRDPLDRQ